MACVEFARNVLNLSDADSTEEAPETANPVIDLMPDQSLENLGHTMRLGAYPCRLTKGTLAKEAYGADLICERHRHRYEFNNAYREAFERAGMVFAGINPERDLAEIIELKGHPFFIATQFHPEFKSRPDRPHPLFSMFLQRALERTE